MMLLACSYVDRETQQFGTLRRTSPDTALPATTRVPGLYLVAFEPALMMVPLLSEPITAGQWSMTKRESRMYFC